MFTLEKGTFSIVPIKSMFGLNPYQQVIYMWLCHHSNQEGICWPSLNTLAQECGMSKYSVIRHLKELEKNGFIKKEARHGENNSNSSNLYKIILPLVSESDHPSVSKQQPLVAEAVTNYNHITKTKEPNSSSSEEEEKIKRVPYEKIVGLYHEILRPIGFTRVKFITLERKTKIKARWGAELPTLEDWQKYFTEVSESDFLCGRKKDRESKPFYADFDWLICPRNCVKVLEQKYSNVRYD